MYDSVITQEDCDREQRKFLKSLGVSSMSELNRILEECNYDIERIYARLGVRL